MAKRVKVNSKKWLVRFIPPFRKLSRHDIPDEALVQFAAITFRGTIEQAAWCLAQQGWPNHIIEHGLRRFIAEAHHGAIDRWPQEMAQETDRTVQTHDFLEKFMGGQGDHGL